MHLKLTGHYILLLLCFLGFVITAPPGEHPTISEGQLDVLRVTRHSLEGKFYNHKAKTGIDIRSNGGPSSFLTITSLQGKTIFSSSKLGNGITRISVMGGEYLVVGDHKGDKSKSTAYRMLRRARGQSALKGLMKFGGSVKLLSRAGYIDSRRVDKTSAMDFQSLLKSKESKQIHQAALEMGRRGVYGIDSTGTMIFYVLAMRIANIHQSASRKTFQPQDCKLDPSEMLKLVTYKMVAAQRGLSLCDNNRQYCKTCPRGEQCLGACGVGCQDCWEMVCGDCCYHRGCLGLNTCGKCRANQLSLACFNVFDFNCDTAYPC